MPLRYQYRVYSTPGPCVTLGGQSFRLRPVVDLAVIGTTGTRVLPALLDTGADEVMLPDATAARLGIDLSRAPANAMTGVGAPPYPVRYAAVRLRLTDGVEFREWPAVVGFTPALVNRALFGIAGGLQYFTATFRGDLSEVELTVNPLYPGT